MNIRRIIEEIIYRTLYKGSIKWMSSPLYAEKFGESWYKVYDEIPNKRSPPIYFGDLKVDLQQTLDPIFPESGVALLKNVLVNILSGWILGRKNYLLTSHSWYGRHINEVAPFIPFLFKKKCIKKIEGVVLSILSDFSFDGNYGHFLLDCIPRLELFYKAGFNISDVDYVLCPKPRSKNSKYLFDRLGIPLEKCIWSEERYRTVRVETLIAPTFPGTRRNYPSWTINFLQKTFTPSPPKPIRRLYVSRTGFTRNPINESTMHSILKKYDFEIYNPVDHDRTYMDFAEATIIVGVHGANLSDLTFCQPGTKVLELIPTEHLFPYYYTLCDAANLKYHCLVCKSEHERKNKMGPSYSNFYVNEEYFDHALAQITK